MVGIEAKEYDMKKTLVMMLAALSMSAVSNVYAQSSALEWKS